MKSLRDSIAKPGTRVLLILTGISIIIFGVGVASFRDSSTESEEEFCRNILPADSIANSDSLSRCGGELESEMTGKPPGALTPGGSTRHSGKQIHAFEQTVDAYAKRWSEDGSEVPSAIRENMSNALAYYGPQVHLILLSHGNSVSGRNGIEISRESMVDFIQAVSQSERQFKRIYDSQIKFTTERVGSLGKDDFTNIPTGDTDKARAVLQESGRVIATLTQIHAVVIADRGDPSSEQIKADLVDNYEQYGKPRLVEMIEARAKAVGVSDHDMHASGTRGALLIQGTGQSYDAAARETDTSVSS
ncbi:hypothetical protein LHJ74_14295 [Streptomyces sp. N2-109]|uniref:OmpA-like domain-containing protein n=1 Tax=Streptomyces gossypii TaxID=2883101 RepID=A0ABT2JT53_9ACTN|nr:hypothetical protein [Streptomyces gossypii]MCT2591066.1 hypothetical protein [Streptomyces gossypii]